MLFYGNDASLRAHLLVYDIVWIDYRLNQGVNMEVKSTENTIDNEKRREGNGNYGGNLLIFISMGIGALLGLAAYTLYWI